jgi:hypothetical protein
MIFLALSSNNCSSRPRLDFHLRYEITLKLKTLIYFLYLHLSVTSSSFKKVVKTDIHYRLAS